MTASSSVITTVTDTNSSSGSVFLLLSPLVNSVSPTFMLSAGPQMVRGLFNTSDGKSQVATEVLV
jgi:hypothetical protein